MTSDFLPQWLKSKQLIHQGEGQGSIWGSQEGLGKGIQTNGMRIPQNENISGFSSTGTNCLSSWEKDRQDSPRGAHDSISAQW